jgi:DNA helicase II / ATP-dependent DNA helicase PcrA
MSAYQAAFDGLNAQQKRAVTTIEGPVLVIAGPGTGKTQLLSVRVAHILAKTDTMPQNVLCLTFTENGAANMRERLTRFIGKSAYDVNISTYHAFGGDLIRRFPEVFAETRLQDPADDLAKRQIVHGIIENLTYDNPLKQLQHHLGDLISTISEVKRALLDAASLRRLAEENAAFIIAANQAVRDAFDDIGKMPTTAKKAIPLFEPLLPALQRLVPAEPANGSFVPLGSLATSSLEQALQDAEATGKSTPLTAWKNQWLGKDPENHFMFAGALETRRMLALADVFEQYQAALEQNGWYDFDDMILRAIEALEKNPDLRYSLQEQYLYLLLDEFQDTNAAQLRLVQLLSDNPVSEGRPNVLAVGDDDQAIYAFQGAQYSNMLDFYRMYREVAVVNLTHNYRSSADILHTARNISTQIAARLETSFDDFSKELHAANPKLPARADLGRHEFMSDVAQYDWTAQQIKQLIDNGTSPSEIAVLAPKHRQLEPLVPYLAKLEVPMRYEKRENILEAPVIKQLVTMSKLAVALHARDEARANALWPEVLSYEFWHIPVSDLWKLSWQVNDKRHDAGSSWSRALLESDQPHFRTPALLLLAVAARLEGESLEQSLDYLIGSDAINIGEGDGDNTESDGWASATGGSEAAPVKRPEDLVLSPSPVASSPSTIKSPLRDFYTGSKVQHSNPELFYDTISHLTVLRARLRDYAKTQDHTLALPDLIAFVEMYEAAEERILNTSPYNQQADAVQLMTVFKSKGLEFAHVFLPSMQDDVWGSSSRGNTNKLTLPPNLAPIRHAGATDDERLRILFVAVTRAKLGLHLTSFARTYSGKGTRHLKYLDEQEQADGTFRALVLPDHAQMVQANDHQAPTLESLELNWRMRHTTARNASTELQGLLGDRLQKYQLSPTHLTRFIDLEYGGPEDFFLNTLLNFPQAPTVHSMFGNAIHDTLEWVQHQVTAAHEVPDIEQVIEHFATELKDFQLAAGQLRLEHDRGAKALRAYLDHRSHMFRPTDKAEHNFKFEGVFIGEAHLAGKVDRMEIDRQNKKITVVDYKTGRPHTRWLGSDSKLHKYRLQLYCYKLLIEGSHTYAGYTVEQGRLEFVEPDAEGRIHTLELSFDSRELEQTRALLQAMWRRVQQLDFPDTTGYRPDITGIKQFEDDLLSGQQSLL